MIAKQESKKGVDSILPTFNHLGSSLQTCVEVTAYFPLMHNLRLTQPNYLTWRSSNRTPWTITGGTRLRISVCVGSTAPTVQRTPRCRGTLFLRLLLIHNPWRHLLRRPQDFQQCRLSHFLRRVHRSQIARVRRRMVPLPRRCQLLSVVSLSYSWWIAN